MKVSGILIEDAKVLVPNEEHKNFTDGKEIITKGTKVSGEPKMIEGLRKGEPFVYRLFRTDENKLIYLNKINKMEPTEVKLGADATVINLKQNVLAKPHILGAIGGAIIGFGYAKYKKHELKKAGIYALVGAVAGFVVGKVVSHTGIISTNK